MTETITNSIRVEARAFFVPERSNPGRGDFFFAYRIRITNEGGAAARLVSRHWVITDGLGNIEEVKGEGVVGEQPRLGPGESFEYTSACPLPTQYGTMQGAYRMERDDGTGFDAQVGPFKLYIPAMAN